MIFEIPVEEPGKIEVVVIWQEWGDVTSTDRTNVILEAYDDQRDNLVQAVGATYEEAIRQDLLPYRIVSVLDRLKFLTLMRLTPEQQNELRKAIEGAMLQEVGAREVGGHIDLRFPTREMAEQAQLRLFERFRDGYWAVDRSTALNADSI
jgi:hypothetical protein